MDGENEMMTITLDIDETNNVQTIKEEITPTPQTLSYNVINKDNSVNYVKYSSVIKQIPGNSSNDNSLLNSYKVSNINEEINCNEEVICNKRKGYEYNNYITNASFIDEYSFNKNPLGTGIEFGNVCAKCGIVSITINGFKKHVKAHSQGFLCKYCPLAFFTSYARNHHLRLHKNGSRYDIDDYCECLICGGSFISVCYLELHLMEMHGEQSILNTSNMQLGPSPKSDEPILDEVPGTRLYKCGNCQWLFNFSLNLDCHMALHPVPSYACALCCFSFDNFDDLVKHVQKHKQDNSDNVLQFGGPAKFVPMNSDNSFVFRKIIPVSICSSATESPEFQSIPILTPVTLKMNNIIEEKPGMSIDNCPTTSKMNDNKIITLPISQVINTIPQYNIPLSSNERPSSSLQRNFNVNNNVQSSNIVNDNAITSLDFQGDNKLIMRSIPTVQNNINSVDNTFKYFILPVNNGKSAQDFSMK